MIPKRVMDEIESWIARRKCGHLQLNFKDGEIKNMNRTESILITKYSSSSPDTKITGYFSSSEDI